MPSAPSQKLEPSRAGQTLLGSARASSRGWLLTPMRCGLGQWAVGGGRTQGTWAGAQAS